jgi:hypothetical protein
MRNDEAAAPDASATPALLVEHARAMAQSEEARLAAAQSRATALLAVAGVLAGLGSGLLARIDGRDYASAAIAGSEIPLVQGLVIASGVIAISTLLWSAASVVGALRTAPEPESQAEELDRFLENDVKTMLAETPSQAAESVIAMLAEQRLLIRIAGKEVDEAFERAIRMLGIALLFGLLLATIVVLATSEKPRQVHLADGGAMQTKEFGDLAMLGAR